VAQKIDTSRYYVLTNVAAGDTKSVAGMVNGALGQAVALRDASELPLQQWVIVDAKYGYMLYCREHGRDYSLEIVNEGVNSKWVSLGKTNKSASGQFWKIGKNGDGTFRITSLWLGTERSLDLVSEGEHMHKLVMKETSSAKSQAWRLVGTPKPTPAVVAKVAPQAATVTVVAPQEAIAKAVESLLVLDTTAVYEITTQEVPDKSLGVGTIGGRIEQAMLVPRTNPFSDWKVAAKGNGLYTITNVKYNGKVMQVRKDGVEDEMVMMADNQNVNEQLWKIVRAPSGEFQITSAAQDGSRSLDFVEDGEERHEIRMRGFNSTLWTFIALTPPAPAKQVVTASVATNKNKLLPGEQLKENQKLFSANSKYSLVQQKDGNLVIYDADQKAVWASGMNGQNVRRCMMQADGNLVQHPASYDLSLWSTQTRGHQGAYAMLQDDGVLVIINRDNQIVWRSH
jgi:hypothetical protein